MFPRASCQTRTGAPLSGEALGAWCLWWGARCAQGGGLGREQQLREAPGRPLWAPLSAHPPLSSPQSAARTARPWRSRTPAPPRTSSASPPAPRRAPGGPAQRRGCPLLAPKQDCLLKTSRWPQRKEVRSLDLVQPDGWVSWEWPGFCHGAFSGARDRGWPRHSQAGPRCFSQRVGVTAGLLAGCGVQRSVSGRCMTLAAGLVRPLGLCRPTHCPVCHTCFLLRLPKPMQTHTLSCTSHVLAFWS